MSNWVSVHQQITGASRVQVDAESGSEGSDADIPMDDGDDDWESEESDASEESEELGPDMDWEVAEDDSDDDGDWNAGDAEHGGAHFMSDDDSDYSVDDAEGKVRPSIHRSEPILKTVRAAAAVRSFLQIQATAIDVLMGFESDMLLRHFASTLPESDLSPKARKSTFNRIFEQLKSCLELLDAFQDLLYEAPASTMLRVSELTENDFSWFGGVFPSHPMLFSGWKGNPFLFSKKHLHWANSVVLEGIRYPSSIDEDPLHAQFKSLYESWLEKLNTVFGLAQLDIVGCKAEVSLIAEIMAKCNLAATGHPYQWAHSASDAYHHQCARYLVLSESEPVSFLPLSAVDPLSADSSNSKAPTPDRPADKSWTVHLQRPLTVIGRHLMQAGMNSVSDHRNACQRVEWRQYGIGFAPDVFPYTKYLARSDDDLVIPRDERLMSLPAEVVSMDLAFGFLAIGFDDGILAAFCMEGGSPRLILYETASDRFDMYNSVHISRRIVRKDSSNDEEIEFEYEFTLLVTRNSAAVDVHILSKHNESPKVHTGDPTIISSNHKLSTKCSETITGFGAPPNDARLSPDGRFLAFVGDDGGVWMSSVRYTANAGDEVSQGTEDDDEFDTTLKFRHFGEVRKLDLEYLFAPMANPPMPVSQCSSAPGTHLGPPPTPRNMTMQYMSWNSESRYFAASSDTFPWVLIFDAEDNGRVVCRIDAALTTFAVAFHPTNPYILAFSNRQVALAYVHIIDLTEHLSNPTEIPATEQPPFVYPPRQILRHDYKIPTEPRSGSYPDLTTLNRPGTNHIHSTDVTFSTLAAKINGILWSDDGQRLHVATNRRVLMHTVVEREPALLSECVSRKVWDGKVELQSDAAEMVKEFATEALAAKRWAGHWRY
ncbi:hypothetical protein HDU98_001701 [Podochytrium sp. JEL0797]|nr:hypothetical protein HDU98_001701 [Podochytrium sp. JEL0797]